MEAEKYIAGLKKAYFDIEANLAWENFEKIKQGATKEDIEKLKEVFPEVPITLIKLLEYVDGTYFRKYKGGKITFFFLGSDLEGFPYYLLSTKEIIKNQQIAMMDYSDYIAGIYDGIEIDEKITDNVRKLKWLHFSDCLNNGGTSQLFIDFSPSEKGKKGQIIRFLHDPDELIVIADSFEEYLKKIIDNRYDFLDKDLIF